MQIAFDIETVANDVDRYYKLKEFRPAKNLVDPEKIKASVETKKQAHKEKAALRWYTGKVICVSLIHAGQKRVWSNNDECELLTCFFDYVEQLPGCVLVGKSSADFDIPFLIGRAMALNLGMPRALVSEYRPIRDVDHIFSYRPMQNEQCATLNDYAFGLGIAAKTGKGSDVAKMYEQGRWSDIQEYCLNDSLIVHEMMKRYKTRYEVKNGS